ncbi:hypothetical protein DVH24_023593 [Malus domestica]|uniref:Cytochrome P450 n=1 Tax=Malus domestica TaxID=3750 RepID=A0A498I344_MALDO|nr:hypothetical protein DVH24_023593 [Malus domestica]
MIILLAIAVVLFFSLLWSLIHILTSGFRTLRRLAKTYGPITSIRLGTKTTIVPQAAQLLLKTHDTVFSSRPKFQALEYLSDGAKGIVLTEHGCYAM